MLQQLTRLRLGIDGGFELAEYPPLAALLAALTRLRTLELDVLHLLPEDGTVAVLQHPSMTRLQAGNLTVPEQYQGRLLQGSPLRDLTLRVPHDGLMTSPLVPGRDPFEGFPTFPHLEALPTPCIWGSATPVPHRFLGTR